jgi:hypothetical protein
MSVFGPSIIENMICDPSGEKRGAKLIALPDSNGCCWFEARSMTRTCGTPPWKLT